MNSDILDNIATGALILAGEDCTIDRFIEIVDGIGNLFNLSQEEKRDIAMRAMQIKIFDPERNKKT